MQWLGVVVTDGVLLDTAQAWVQAPRRTSEEVCGQWDDGLPSRVPGQSLPAAVTELSQALHAEPARVVAVLRGHLMDTGRVREQPGARTAIETARNLGCKVAVVSEWPIDLVTARLARCRLLGQVDAIMTPDLDDRTPRRPFPAPDLYRCVMRALDVGHAIAVADTVESMAAARAARLHVVGVGYGLPPRVDAGACVGSLVALDLGAIASRLAAQAGRAAPPRLRRRSI